MRKKPAVRMPLTYRTDISNASMSLHAAGLRRKRHGRTLKYATKGTGFRYAKLFHGHRTLRHRAMNLRRGFR